MIVKTNIRAFIKTFPVTKAILVLVGLMALNWLISTLSFRLDLTQDKRYTLSDISHNLLKNDVADVHIEVLLEGDLNPGFARMYHALNDMLKEFHQINGDISFNFVDYSSFDQNEKRAYSGHWQSLNITPINVVDTDSDGKTIQKRLFPWVIIHKDTLELPIRLLSEIPGKNGQENINVSIQNLEYKLIDGIKRFYQKSNRRIAFIEGHNELNEEEVFDITSGFANYFRVDRGQLSGSADILSGYEAIIVAKPEIPFSEEEKYIIDQYIMNGGKALWLIDGVKISMDSLSETNQTLGFYHDVNLEDQLFKYGVRINPGLVEDQQSVLVPVNTALKGQKPEFHPMPWYYSPLFQSNPLHAITRNISPVKGEFASAIDLVNPKDKNVRKTVLLTSSSRSKYTQVPIAVDLSIAERQVDQSYFDNAHIPVAVLLEGTFSSVFNNRLRPKGVADTAPIRIRSEQTKMIVISDGDMIKNEVIGYGKNRQIIPLGYDRVTKRQFYGNKDFLLNCINYLTDDEGWMMLRNKVVKLRLLNKGKIDKERTFWMVFNTAFPIVLVGLIWLFYFIIRRRKYSTHIL